MYVVPKSEGQSNHLIIIIIINDDVDDDDDDDYDDDGNGNDNHNHNHNHNPLLTLGSIYSTDASAPEKTSETNNSNET